MEESLNQQEVGKEEEIRAKKLWNFISGLRYPIAWAYLSHILSHDNMHESAVPSRDLRPSLVFLTGDLIAVPIPLERDEVVLGRALEAGVRINDTKVSRMHASIKKVVEDITGRTDYLLTDLESRNGTFLNEGQEPVYHEELVDNDAIVFGTVKCKFKCL